MSHFKKNGWGNSTSEILFCLEKFDKIYISREKSPNRKIVNEQEVIKKLEQFGFKKIIMEDMTFEEKIHIMDNARYLCCGESSSMTNIIFARKNLKIINLNDLNYWNVDLQEPYYSYKEASKKREEQ